MTKSMPHPKKSWVVINVRGEWVAVKRPTGILTEADATKQADAKNSAAVCNRRRFNR